MKRCHACTLVLPLDCFNYPNDVCNLCLETPRYREPVESRGEWQEMNTVSKINDLFMRQGRHK
jgi:rRNA maturation endonuclease Nob1